MDTRAKTVEICGRTVTVRPFRFFDLEQVTAAANDSTQVWVLFALALRMSPDEFRREFAEMDVLDAAALDVAIQEVNADFFARKASQMAVSASVSSAS